MLVLSLFPGADLFGMAFEQCGFCVVRGPDVITGGDICTFHAIANKFDGVIGGPPCQLFSNARNKSTFATFFNLVPEFIRIVQEAKPRWWVMENVPNSPLVEGAVFCRVLDAWHYGAKQHRERRFTSNIDITPYLKRTDALHPDPFPCVTATEYKVAKVNTTDTRRAGRKVGRRLTIEEVNELMGLPRDYATPCLSLPYQYSVRGNGVPLEMGRAIANAIKEYYAHGLHTHLKH